MLAFTQDIQIHADLTVQNLSLTTTTMMLGIGMGTGTTTQTFVVVMCWTGKEQA